MYIFCWRALAPCRRRPLSSNVRHRNSKPGHSMRQVERLLRAQDRKCFICGLKLRLASAEVARLPAAKEQKSDAVSFACCRKTAEHLIELEPKGQFLALVNPGSSGVCLLPTLAAARRAQLSPKPGLPTGRQPHANADLCPPRRVDASQIQQVDSEAKLAVAPLSNKCSVCGRPAIPGDSLCYTHNN